MDSPKNLRCILFLLPLYMLPRQALSEEVKKSDPDTTLFERPFLDSKAGVVITRGDYLDAEFLKHTVWKNDSRPKRCYSVYVKLSQPGSDPVLLGARLRIETGPPNDVGSVVLAALINQEGFNFVVAEGADLELWIFPLNKRPATWSIIRAEKPWATAADRPRLDENRVSTALSLVGDKLRIEIQELDFGQVTIIDVEDHGTRFKIVDQHTPAGWHRQRR